MQEEKVLGIQAEYRAIISNIVLGIWFHALSHTHHSRSQWKHNNSSKNKNYNKEEEKDVSMP